MTTKEVLNSKYKNDYEYHKAKINTSQTIVCVAGVTEGSFRFYESLPILTKNFNVVLFNNPGVDGSPEKVWFTVDELADKFQHILNLLEVESYYLVGHSMGGFTAQRMAINNPEKVNKLVLFGTSFGSYQSEKDIKHIMDTKHTIQKSIENLKNHERIFRVEDYSFTEEFQNANPDIMERYLKEKTETYKLPKHVVVSHFMCGGRFSSLGEGHKMLMPTLIIHGTKDRMVNIEGGIILAKTIPNARFLKVEGAGHSTFIENVNIMDKVVDFIINDAEIGEVLEKDFHFTEEQVKEDLYFRAHAISKSYSNFLKELFMVDEIEEMYKEFMTKIQNNVKV